MIQRRYLHRRKESGGEHSAHLSPSQPPESRKFRGECQPLMSAGRWCLASMLPGKSRLDCLVTTESLDFAGFPFLFTKGQNKGSACVEHLNAPQMCTLKSLKKMTVQ